MLTFKNYSFGIRYGNSQRMSIILQIIQNESKWNVINIIIQLTGVTTECHTDRFWKCPLWKKIVIKIEKLKGVFN